MMVALEICVRLHAKTVAGRGRKSICGHEIARKSASKEKHLTANLRRILKREEKMISSMTVRPEKTRPDAQKTDDDWMVAALDVAAKNPQAPFGAVIVDANSATCLAAGVNDSRRDATAHGEMVALQNYFQFHARGTHENLVLYTTAEPCPMCASAAFWSGIKRIVYGVAIPWLVQHGWRQLPPRCADLLAPSVISVETASPEIVSRCEMLFMNAKQA